MNSLGVWGTEENGYKGAGVLLTYHIFMMLWMWSVVYNTSYTIMAHTVAQWFYAIQSPQAPRYSRDRAEIGPRSGRVDEVRLARLPHPRRRSGPAIMNDAVSQAQGGARDLPRCGPCGTLCGLALTFASTRVIVLRHLGSVIFGSIVVAIARLIMIVVCS